MRFQMLIQLHSKYHGPTINGSLKTKTNKFLLETACLSHALSKQYTTKISAGKVLLFSSQSFPIIGIGNNFLFCQNWCILLIYFLHFVFPYMHQLMLMLPHYHDKLFTEITEVLLMLQNMTCISYKYLAFLKTKKVSLIYITFIWQFTKHNRLIIL